MRIQQIFTNDLPPWQFLSTHPHDCRRIFLFTLPWSKARKSITRILSSQRNKYLQPGCFFEKILKSRIWILFKISAMCSFFWKNLKELSRKKNNISIQHTLCLKTKAGLASFSSGSQYPIDKPISQFWWTASTAAGHIPHNYPSTKPHAWFSSYQTFS